jgi:putative heme-binding domain-containing protein
MSWHPDGSLMVADWSGGYALDGEGAIWRIDAPAGNDAQVRAQTFQLLKLGVGGKTAAELASLLGHPDQRVRLEAQFELVARNDAAALIKAANDKTASLLSRIHGIWGYGQLLRKSAAPVRLIADLMESNEPEIRAQSATVLSESTVSPSEAAGLVKLLKDESPRVRLRASLALGRIKTPSAVEPLLAVAATEIGDAVIRHGIVTALANCATSAELLGDHNHPSKAVRLACVLALRRQSAQGIEVFLKDPEPAIQSEAARAIHDNAGIPEALGPLSEFAIKETTEDATAFRAINANLRIGKTSNAARLLTVALHKNAKITHRAEALGGLLAWKQPSTLDRVDGYSRSIRTEPIKSLLSGKLDELLSLSEPELRAVIIEIVIAHGLTPRPEQVAAIIAQHDAPATLRAEAMRLMAGAYKDSGPWNETLRNALADTSPPELQQEALAALLPEAPQIIAERSEAILKKGKTQQRQHVIGLLAQASHPSCDAVLERLGKMLLEDKCEAALQLDLISALEKRRSSNQALSEFVRMYSASSSGSAHSELLEGGDAIRGKDLAQNHLGANCLACHSFSDGGSNVGPNLSGVGSQKDRSYLLESLLIPSAQLAPGFGLSTISLRDGTQISGTIDSETRESLALKLPDGSNKVIAISQILGRTPPISMMPPMLGILSPAEIRDVVAFLSSLKTPKKK